MNIFVTGDIIKACIIDEDYDDQVIHHEIVGRVIRSYKINDYTGYDVELDEPTTFGRYPQYSSTNIHEVTNDMETNITLSTISVWEYQITDHQPVKQLSFADALKHQWRSLTFRKVKKIIKRDCNISEIVEKYIDGSGNLAEHDLSKDETPSKENQRNIIYKYTKYFGFTENDGHWAPDSYPNSEIFFSSKNFGQLDFDQQITGDFQEASGHTPPNVNSLVCGVVENGNKGYHFKQWFICSVEFYKLWLYIMRDEIDVIDPQVIVNLDNLKTAKWLNWFKNPNTPVKIKQKRYKYSRCESSSIYYRDIYWAIGYIYDQDRNNNTLCAPDGLDVPHQFVDQFVRHVVGNNQIMESDHDISQLIDYGWISV